MIEIIKKKIIDRTFEIVVFVKSFFGFFEILAGVMLAFSGRLQVNNLIIYLTKEEITQEPNDFFANSTISFFDKFSSGSHVFAVVYLIFHGVINLFLVVALIKNKIWAYPCAILGFGLFIFYQIYRYFHTLSISLLMLTLFDIFIVWIIYLEFKEKKLR